MSTSVGQQLRKTRQAKQLSVEQVSRLTFIRTSHIEALEAGNLDQLPSMAQARGFVRSYAQFLELDATQLLTQLSADPKTTPIPEADPETPAQQNTLSSPTADIFIKLGLELKNQRELLGLSYEEIEHQTHLRVHYLRAVEAGDFSVTSSPVQGRGMLNNYATFLGLDADPLLLQYADGVQLAHDAHRQEIIEETPKQKFSWRAFLRRLIPGNVGFPAVLIAGLTMILFIIWAVGRVSVLQEQVALTPISELSINLLISPTPSNTPIPPTASPTPNPDGEIIFEPGEEIIVEDAEDTENPEDTAPSEGTDPIQVRIIVRERAWMRVIVDDVVQFEGRVAPGAEYIFSGFVSINLTSASGSSLQVFYNEHDLGLLGIFGEVVEQVFTPGGFGTPTPIVSPTPEVTETPTPTPTP